MLSLSYKWGNGDTDMVYNSAKINQLYITKPVFKPRQCDSRLLTIDLWPQRYHKQLCKCIIVFKVICKVSLSQMTWNTRFKYGDEGMNFVQRKKKHICKCFKSNCFREKTIRWSSPASITYLLLSSKWASELFCYILDGSLRRMNLQ